MADIKFETKLDFGKISDKSNKRLTYTSWNDGDFKFDIRDWYDNGNVGKGITLTKTELKSLYDLMGEVFGAESDDLPDLDNFTDKEVKDDTEPSDASEDYPEDIKNIFDKLDEVFKDFTVSKAYDVMPFATSCGKRVQYLVRKGRKKLPDYENIVADLKLNSFVTDKGNLFIYTL